MQQHHFNRKKLSAIMNYDTFVQLEQWYHEKYRPNIPRNALVPFTDWVYSKTGDRFYLSKWLEKFILKYIEIEQPNWIARKVDNRGEQILRQRTIKYVNRTETSFVMEGYKKDPNQIKGEPDIKILRPMQPVLYYEVKIGNDRLSEDQKDFIKKGFGEVIIVRSVEDFLLHLQQIRQD